jgi:capsid assembly protease
MNEFLLPHIAARVFDVPLMIDGHKAAAIASALGARITGGAVTVEGANPIDHVAFASGRPSAGRLGDQLGKRIEAQGDEILPHIVNGVAVIPIEGTLVHKGKWLGSSSGDTSYEGLQTRVMRARRDRRVKAVVFEVDSFGGEVAGAFDTAEMIAQLSVEKPTLAILTDYALSAGYLLASAARAIAMPETGYAGSIGVVTMHVDYSRQIEARGMTVTVLTSGERKAEGNPFEPLPAEVASRIRAELDASRDVFAAAVGRHRGARMSKKQALATEAGAFQGEAALAAGLVDSIIHPNEAFDAFVSQVSINSALGRLN